MYRKNLGDQIKDIVDDAIDSCNFQDLNDRIRNTANRAVDDFNRATRSFQYDRRRNQGPFTQGSFHNRDRRTRNGQSNTQWNRNQNGKFEQNRTWNEPKNNKFARNNVGNAAAITSMVLGIVGLSIFGIVALIMYSIVWISMGSAIVCNIIGNIFLVLAGLCLIPLAIGIKKRKRIKRFQTYLNLVAPKGYCEIKRMAEYIDKSEKFVVKDLKDMMVRGFFKEAHFDEKKTCFMIDQVTYEQYLQAQESFKAREEELKKQAEERKANPDVEQNEELLKAIQEGKEYIEAIRKANDDIPGEEISRKLDHLEDVIRKVFICVEKHPEKLPELRKFMQYYLPITKKLVNAYKEFDAQPIQGENITNSKKEIENTIDTINTAFEKLLDSLYEDEAMEVSSDISVLNALFAQEGLTKKDFDLK